MKTIGLIGGMSWESTVTYYQAINEAVKRALGGFHSAKLLMYSVDFAEIERNMSSGDWGANVKVLSDAAGRLARGGADFILVCTNTLHRIYPQLCARCPVPMLHIADAAADALVAKGIRRAALLGTRFTMAEAFYRDRLAAQGIETMIPPDEDAALVDRVIFDELCLGVVSDESRRAYTRIIGEMADRGAEGVILGCTEIGMLISQKDSPLPVFDTTLIHAEAAARLALNDELPREEPA